VPLLQNSIRGLSLLGLLPADARLERVATGCVWSEGPLWIPDRAALRWSDIPNDRILEYSPRTGETTVYATGVEFTNGRALDRDGSIVQCSHGLRRVERDRDGEVTCIVDHWRGARLNSPNDVVVAPDGALWFTDPAYGITEAREGHPGEREYEDLYVFRLDQESGDLAPVILDVEAPNGLAFSPDGALLYVADSSAVGSRTGVGNRYIRAYDVQGGRHCKNGRVFATIHDGVPDGIAVDEHGNVWSSSATGVVVFGANGLEVGRIPVSEVVGNLCFGGEDGSDLYIAATTSIYRIRTLTVDAWAARASTGGAS